jgi:hypothetical protein
MGINIHPGESTRDATQDRNELIKHANGFAQVLPKDKREVVLVLRNVFHQVTLLASNFRFHYLCFY